MSLPSWYVLPPALSSSRRRKVALIAFFVFFLFGSVKVYTMFKKLSSSSSSGSSVVFSPLPTRTIFLDGTEYVLEIADTPLSRQQGLSDRPSLSTNRGMLFIFEKPVRHAFWMPRMHFPLDILFLRNGVIVDLVKNLPAPQGSEQPARYQPNADYDQVLELNVGSIDRLKLTVGIPLSLE